MQNTLHHPSFFSLPACDLQQGDYGNGAAVSGFLRLRAIHVVHFAADLRAAVSGHAEDGRTEVFAGPAADTGGAVDFGSQKNSPFGKWWYNKYVHFYIKHTEKKIGSVKE